MNNEKTIRMPKWMLDLWLHHLRSGKVKQGRGALFNGKGYCCLGVLQCAVTGGYVENIDSSGDTGTFNGLPSAKWLEENGITFKNRYRDRETASPFLPGLGKYADDANDVGLTFSEIAYSIEECTETY